MTDPAWNPFLGEQTAASYASARPDYHPQAVAAVRRLLGLSQRVAVAADVGCGTGMSSRALRGIADRVIGLDVSGPMVRAAAPAPDVSFLQAAAERLPLQSQAIDVVASAAAFHWFGQGAMLAEVRRVLRPGGGLAVYTDFFAGRLTGLPDFTDWLAETYRPRFPAPPRRAFFDADAAAEAGLQFAGEEELASERRLTASQLTDYLMTQSNATSALDAGRISRGALRSWLLAEIRRFLPGDEPGTAEFTGHVWCSRLTSD